ncbi:MAG: uracil-DNA glycosylase [Minisyncoccia bacterium]
MLSKEEKFEALKKIRDKLLVFTQSPLYEYRTKNNFLPVIGEGNHDAHIMIIGEAPGKKEALTGRPFCGASGKFLDELCAHIGLERSDVYVTNIVKDRPEDNRDPSQKEIDLYGPFLDRQLEIIQPKVIATLGRFSMVYIMQKLGLSHEIEPISALHGKVLKGTLPYGEVSLVSLYHPAVALYNGSMRDVLKKDFESLKEFI